MTENEASYQQAVVAISKITDPEFRAGAIEGLVARRLKIENSYPDSALGMRLRSEAMELVALA